MCQIIITRTYTYFTAASGSKFKAVADEEVAITPLESMCGVAAVLVMVTISGYAAIYFEAML